ncbi:MAG TPA: hypothetical protein DCE41_20565 [Cytophagales bacterium]|nr:hypothetical protein [Cytophagales bacterium]HAA21970.1 hypothetical protein [Cytophagales bacterium]HAP61333.1 hypothetical protein [Cytophagales bacterium]
MPVIRLQLEESIVAEYELIIGKQLSGLSKVQQDSLIRNGQFLLACGYLRHKNQHHPMKSRLFHKPINSSEFK